MENKRESSVTEMRHFIDEQDPQKAESSHQALPSANYEPVPGVTSTTQPGQVLPVQPVSTSIHTGYSNPLNLPSHDIVKKVQKVPGAEIMDNLNQIMIRQMPQLVDAFTACEIENVYYIHTYDGGEKGKKVFKGRERSTCVARHCCLPECRPFNMFVTKKKQFGRGGFLRFERNYSCTCMCCNRPYMLVYDIEESMKGVGHRLLRSSTQDVLIGRVHDPYHCCDLTFNCYNEAGVKDYFIRGNCCQCGICCHCPSGPCKRVNFSIKDKDGEEVGSIEKVWNSCFRDVITNADTYIANFPAQASWKQKAVILAATIMIDFRHFEQKKKSKQHY